VCLHPCADGNGRVGRLLIPLMLYQKKILSYPVLYLSDYFDRRREQYLENLRLVDREQQWEVWIKFFLQALKTQAEQTRDKISQMRRVYEEAKQKIRRESSSGNALDLLDMLFIHPIISFGLINKKLKINHQTIYNLLKKFENWGLLKALPRGKRKVYVFGELLEIL